MLNILLSNSLFGSGNWQLLPVVDSATHPNGTHVWCRGLEEVSLMVRRPDGEQRSQKSMSETEFYKISNPPKAHLKNKSLRIHRNVGLGSEIPTGCGLRGSRQLYLNLKGPECPLLTCGAHWSNWTLLHNLAWRGRDQVGLWAMLQYLEDNSGENN